MIEVELDIRTMLAGIALVGNVVAVVGVYWKLRITDTEQGKDIEAVAKSVADLEKEYIKELNEIDDKLERVFKALEKSNNVREGLKKEYITINQHEDKCKMAKLEIAESIRESGDKIKDQVKKDVTEIRDDLQGLFKLIQSQQAGPAGPTAPPAV